MENMTLLVTYTCKPGQAGAYVQALKSSVVQEKIRAEDGCLRYDYHISCEAADTAVLLEQWRDSVQRTMDSIEKSAGGVSYEPDVDCSEWMLAAKDLEEFIAGGPDMGRAFMEELSNGIAEGASTLYDTMREVTRNTGAVFREELDAVCGRIDSAMSELGTAPPARTAGNAGASAASGTQRAEGPANMADAVSRALSGAAVYMSGRKVGKLLTTQQGNGTIARGGGLVPVG